MGYGLVNVQRQLSQEANSGLADAAGLEQQRKLANRQLKEAHKAGRMQAMATGAGIGATAGPYGAAVGALVGLLSYEFM